MNVWPSWPTAWPTNCAPVCCPTSTRWSREHADLADDLRSLWATMLVTDCVAAGASQYSSSRTTPFPHASDPGAVDPAGAVPSVFGDYELLEELGRGGMGVVYQGPASEPRAYRGAEDDLAAAPIRRRPTWPAFAARPKRPPGSTTRPSCPIYEVGEHAGPAVLHDEVRRRHDAWRGGWPTVRCRRAKPRRCWRPICRAIHYAHERGVLHRDLKPSNILIDEEGRPHVTDFGLAKRVTQTTTG